MAGDLDEPDCVQEFVSCNRTDTDVHDAAFRNADAANRLRLPNYGTSDHRHAGGVDRRVSDGCVKVPAIQAGLH